MTVDGLTPKQQRFVEEYLKDLNATQAAIRAGYAEPSANREGSRLLSNADIQEAVAKAKAARSRRLSVNADWVLRRLVRNVNRASATVAVRDAKGEPTGEYRYEGAVVNKALELIGKHVGMFTDNLKLSGSVGTWDLTKLTNDQLLNLAHLTGIATGSDIGAGYDPDGDDPEGVDEAPAIVPLAEGPEPDR
jgi:phage terminase small subunit